MVVGRIRQYKGRQVSLNHLINMYMYMCIYMYMYQCTSVFCTCMRFKEQISYEIFQGVLSMVQEICTSTCAYTLIDIFTDLNFTLSSTFSSGSSVTSLTNCSRISGRTKLMVHEEGRKRDN